MILDIRRDPASGDIDLIHWLRAYNIHPIIVLTKADKLSRQQVRKRAGLIAGELAGISPEAPVVFSAKTRQGKDEIWERVREACGLLIDDCRRSRF